MDDDDTGVNTVCPVALVGWASVEGEGITTTTGGGNAVPVRPSSIEDLRTLASNTDPQVIVIAEVFETGSDPISIASNKTLVGLDSDATIMSGIDIDGVRRGHG
jgi:pectinesterase/pectate lyase